MLPEVCRTETLSNKLCNTRSSVLGRVPWPAVALLLLLPCFVANAHAANCGPDSLLILTVNRAIESCVRQDFRHAEFIMDSLLEASPQQPEHWMYHASVINYRMVDEESFRDEDSFFNSLDQAQLLVDQLRSAGESSPRLDYIEGSLASWRAYHASRKQQYFRAMREGLRGADLLESVEQACPTFSDVLLGTGSYRFWRSAKLRWLPFVSDEREQSLELVSRAMHEGLFHPAVAASNLAWMLMELERYEEAILLCEDWLAKYPESRLFLFPYADALLANGHYSHAKACYTKLLSQYACVPENNHVNEFLCTEKLSQVAMHLEGPERVLEIGQQALNLEVAPEHRERFKERYERLEALMRRCQKMLDSDR